MSEADIHGIATAMSYELSTALCRSPRYLTYFLHFGSLTLLFVRSDCQVSYVMKLHVSI
jgi:hypothetical protein